MERSRPLSGPLPLYYQIKQLLRAEIERGTYQPGDRLPSEAELVQRYEVSRITVHQAMTELESEGIVDRRTGKGTYVAERPIEQDLIRLTDFVEDMKLAGLSPSSRVLSVVHEKAETEVAEALHLSAGEDVIRIDRLRLANEQPIAYDTTWLPLRFGLLISEADLAHETIYDVLETRYTIPIEHGTFHITAAAATSEQAQFLHIASGTGLLLIQRLSYTTGDVPVSVQNRYYRTDRVSYRVTLRRHGDHPHSTTSLEELKPIFEETSREKS